MKQGENAIKQGDNKQRAYASTYAEFITVTCLEWKFILEKEKYKQIVIDSLEYLVKDQRVAIYGFVIMNNHFHLLWQMLGKNNREEVQRDFLKFTAQQILKGLRNEDTDMLSELLVSAKERKYQVWKRNSLGVPLWSENVIVQKLAYIHNNPVRAGLCKFPEEYKYSSAGFYMINKSDWKFLIHYNG